MNGRRTLFKYGAIFVFREHLNYYVLGYLRERLRATVIDSVLARYRLSINVRAQDGLCAIGGIGRCLYALFGVFNVFFDPPVFRIALFIVLPTLIIGSVYRLVASRCTSDAVIRDVVNVRVGREVLGSAHQRTGLIND